MGENSYIFCPLRPAVVRHIPAPRRAGGIGRDVGQEGDAQPQPVKAKDGVDEREHQRRPRQKDQAQQGPESGATERRRDLEPSPGDQPVDQEGEPRPQQPQRTKETAHFSFSFRWNLCRTADRGTASR